MSLDNPHSFVCSACQSSFTIESALPMRFCPVCGCLITPPNPSSSPATIDSYQLIESIGRGGMGEVFLAYDSSCERRIALKRIREDLLKHPQIRRRFLREARITCQLTHPAIIPIYNIQAAGRETYYTMPFVEGETLKQIIRKTRQQEKKGEKLNHMGGSIPALMRIFLTICQAVAYAHSKDVLHRDLKLENIIIGKYGEVLILDWGLAKFISSPTQEEESLPIPSDASLPSDVTRSGKIVGTIAYMAPERALGQPATIQTDIYSLGVILYQLLTLRSPFRRGTLEEFKKTVAKEEWIDPVLAAPHREISRILARITEKCLANDLSIRYQSVDELIHDLESYIEGRSDWFLMAELDTQNKVDWEFQENVLIAEHVAITRVTEEAEWVSLMISRSSFPGNTKIEVDICLGENSQGIGFLLSVPEASERHYINDGYCLWLGSDLHKSTRLLRSNVEVVHAPDIVLKRHQTYRVRIEKIDKSIHVYLNDTLQLSYIAHLPLIGTHVGLLARDADLKISPLQIFVGSLSIMVNCLAVPDALLALRHFNEALTEYRRIAYSFPDRAEGREAIFRSGLTFLEQAKEINYQDDLVDQALNEFEKLHGTPSAPLEYLGKALVYQTLQDYQEELKCFEIAYRRYPNHPFLPMLQEQILSRMHDLSRSQRIPTYQFILLAIRHLPLTEIDIHTRKLFTSVQKHWEPLSFIEDHPEKDKSSYDHFAIQLAFWLAKPYVLEEILADLMSKPSPSTIDIGNVIFCLIELGAWTYAKKLCKNLKKEFPDLPASLWQSLEPCLACHEYLLEEVYQSYFAHPRTYLSKEELRSLLYFLDQALDQGQTHLVQQTLNQLTHCEFSFDEQLLLNVRLIWTQLYEKNWQGAEQTLHAYSLEFLNKESTPLHFLYGCWLQATEGKDMAYVLFTGILHVSYPRTWTLASYYLSEEIQPHSPWFDRAFLWEKRQLYRQLALYYHCAGEEETSQHFKHLYQQQFIHVEL